MMNITTENPTLTHSMLYARDVVPYLSRFIESGGTLREAVDGREGPPIYGVMVTYNNKSVLLADGHMGSLHLMVPNNLETGFMWEVIVVRHEDLDTAVCYWLDVPRP